MLRRLRRWLHAASGPPAPEPGPDRTSGEEAWLTQDEEAKEATASGMPRVKWGSQPR